MIFVMQCRNCIILAYKTQNEDDKDKDGKREAPIHTYEIGDYL